MLAGGPSLEGVGNRMPITPSSDFALPLPELGNRMPFQLWLGRWGANRMTIPHHATYCLLVNPYATAALPLGVLCLETCPSNFHIQVPSIEQPVRNTVQS